MGWEIGFDSNWNRDVGYGVPAFCDHPGCNQVIDRGLSYVCGGDVYGGEAGCGLFFCGDHRSFYDKRIGGKIETVELCYRCGHYKKPYKPKPDHPDWIKHKATDSSWAEWRKQLGQTSARMTVRKLTDLVKWAEDHKAELPDAVFIKDNVVSEAKTIRIPFIDKLKGPPVYIDPKDKIKFTMYDNRTGKIVGEWGKR